MFRLHPGARNRGDARALQVSPLIGQIEKTAAIREERKIPDDLAVVGGHWGRVGIGMYGVQKTSAWPLIEWMPQVQAGSRLGNQGSTSQVNRGILLPIAELLQLQ